MKMAYLGISLEEVFKASEIKCSYRNCNNTFLQTNDNRLYCCSGCRSAESVYRKRDAKVKRPQGRPVGWRGTYKKRQLKQEILSRKINLDENGNEL
jgi:protein-arginine kinase activator protein McsA